MIGEGDVGYAELMQRWEAEGKPKNISDSAGGWYLVQGKYDPPVRFIAQPVNLDGERLSTGERVKNLRGLYGTDVVHGDFE